MENIFDLEYAGHRLTLGFHYPGTAKYFYGHLHRSAAMKAEYRVDPAAMDSLRKYIPEDLPDEELEARAVSVLAATALLRWNCSIFHAVAFCWKGQAWLLTAPPGTGKTTQYFNWQRLFPGEITMISGDMPVVESRDDGSVWIWPSSWNGKERIRSRISAPLGGIVLLEQGSEDSIAPLPPREALIPFMRQFMAEPETDREILELTALLERMLQSASCWKMVNRGGDDSTRLLRDTFSRSLKEED